MKSPLSIHIGPSALPCIVRDALRDISVRPHTVGGARLSMATLDFDSHKQGGALTGGGVEGDTENPRHDYHRQHRHFGDPVKRLR
jgi:hypothetical protein